MNIEMKREELIADCVDTCLSDVGYLKSVISDYYTLLDDAMIERLYNEAFCDRP